MAEEDVCLVLETVLEDHMGVVENDNSVVPVVTDDEFVTMMINKEYDFCYCSNTKGAVNLVFLVEGTDLSGSLLGIKAAKWEHNYALYIKHSQQIGFSVKKSTSRRANKKDRPFIERYFRCSCEGTHGNKSKGGFTGGVEFFNNNLRNVIKEVYPTSRHRLCQRHIQQNAISHFGKLKGDRPFQNLFNKCLNGCYNEPEFEETWRKMLKDYGLEGHAWFKRLYKHRVKWSTALNNEYFSAGILSSQRSESTNHAMGFQASKTTSVTAFFGIFETTVKRWRSEEERKEFNGNLRG